MLDSTAFDPELRPRGARRRPKCPFRLRQGCGETGRGLFEEPKWYAKRAGLTRKRYQLQSGLYAEFSAHLNIWIKTLVTSYKNLNTVAKGRASAVPSAVPSAVLFVVQFVAPTFFFKILFAK